jgi:uncharacterized membrane protein YedE/YeeE
MSTQAESRKSGKSQAIGTSSVNALSLAMSLVMGTFFGIVLVKSEVVRWERVHAMFRFEEMHMYLIIGTGVAVSAVLMFLLRKSRAKSLEGDTFDYQPKKFTKGTIIGGFIFGVGWAIAGTCPGPIYTLIGAGVAQAWATLAGALIGMYAYAFFKNRLPH